MIDRGIFEASIGTLPLARAVDPVAPFQLELQHARVYFEQPTPRGMRAVFGGGMTERDVRGIVVPIAAERMATIVATECVAQPSEQALCGCTGRGRLLIDVFDDNRDCTITAAELAVSSIVASLLSPDLDVRSAEPLLSFSIAVDLAPAEFRD